MYIKNFFAQTAQKPLNSNVSSLILDLKNKLLEKCQNSKLAQILSETVFFAHIDKIIFALLLGIFTAAPFFSTGIIGLFAILFIFTILLKLFVKKGEKITMTPLDAAVAVFLTVSILSLLGSSLFILSLKGFLKVLIYIGFYFCLTHWLKENKSKIWPIMALVAILMCFESAVGILQNFGGVQEISGWQDVSNLDVNEVISRSYGTLKPFNPNLLAGYLLPGLAFLFYFFSLNLINSQKKRTIIFAGLILLNIVTLIYTGCRGAYLGLMAFFAAGGFALIVYINNFMGGFSNLKKRYKNLLWLALAGFMAFLITNPAISKRILSIFTFREDSSISFRLNVYKSSLAMFLDNPIIGIGLGNQNFREIYGLYMRTGFDALGTYSVPLEIAVETGILGLISFFAILFIALLHSFKFLSARLSPNIKEKILVFSMLMMILLLMIHGIIDTIFYRPQVQMLFWFALAVINVYVLNERAE